jgi:hypothetical protein
LRRRLLAIEFVDEPIDPLVEEVVAEVHHERVVPDERFTDQHCVRQPTRRVLLDVSNANTPRRSVANRRANLRLRIADDDADVPNACRGERFDAVEEDRLVRDGDELLGARVGQRSEACSATAAQDQTFH